MVFVWCVCYIKLTNKPGKWHVTENTYKEKSASHEDLKYSHRLQISECLFLLPQTKIKKMTCVRANLPPKASSGAQGAAGEEETLCFTLIDWVWASCQGRIPPGKQIPVGYWESVTPPDHTPSVALREERRPTERGREWQSASLCTVFRTWAEEEEMWGEKRKWHFFGAVECFGQPKPQTPLVS